MYFSKHPVKSLILVLASLSWITACQHGATPLYNKPLVEQALNASVYADFAPDGRLWRLIPTENAVFLQMSLDNGKSYGQAVRVNAEDQDINVWPENPPIVAVAPSGRIHVLYYANERQKAASFFTYSDDNGKTFSKPMPVSDHADSARNYMDKMLVDTQGRVYLFWHDTRHEKHMPHPGELSLFYAVADKSNSGHFNNLKVSDNICSCCRTAAALTGDDRPVLLARMVFADDARDHALLAMEADGRWSAAQRISYDDWKIDACPEHGPAMAIDRQNRIHMAWFTQGDRRQGLFYAYSDNQGRNVSEPLAIGNPAFLPGHADVLALDDKVALTWQEFDGDRTHVWLMTSNDRGSHWTAPRELAKASNATSFPKLITNNKQVYLSWTGDNRHRLIEIAD